ncbi:hypothetical protein YDYSG_42210 [Paenibacillus tyrfis]|uniref:response regulator n=1 Tax=Paenibacillus TaxID=44249 RepID=UPI00248FB7DD|nr:response regulator [Paenibacillus tyrfis]GLI08191.1 hypothetical protein YDYSG_42210 [Paenibacillus tyrfis]GMX64023.1 hypothetical protein Elgi_04640 [Paenibacillus elgii]
MYRMIVVDDEAWIRERLVHTIDWGKLDIGFVHEATCGEEALALAGEVQPDLILTDIRMPRMDGLELIERIKEQRLAAKVVIISGFSDFEYAKKALSLGASDYILKPVEDDDLLDVVARCLEQIETDRRKEALLKKADDQVNKRLPLLKEMLFSKLIMGHKPDEPKLREALNDFGLKNKGLRHACLVLQVPEPQAFPTENKPEANFTQFVLRNLLQDFLPNVCENEIVFVHADEVVCIVSSFKEDDELARACLTMFEDIRKIVHKIIGSTIIIGLGGAVGDLLDVSASYRQAKQMLLHGYLDTGRSKETKSAAGPHKTGGYRLYDTEALINHIRVGNKAAALASLDQIVRENGNIRPIDLKFIYIDIVNSIVRTTVESSWAGKDFSNFSLHFFELLQQSQSTDEIHGLLGDTITKIIDFLEHSQSKRRRKVIDKALEYMELHYPEELNLNAVAERFYLNASYFSKIFKEELGVSYTKYLMEFRVNKAAELMSDPTLKIYEISRRVGYEDVQYFTKMFKSIKGITPGQYREKIR